MLVPPRGDGARARRPPLEGAESLAEPRAATPGGERVAALLDDVWLAEPSELARAQSGVLVTREGHCYDAERGELWFAGETAEAVLLQLDARRRALAEEVEELERRAERAAERRRPPVPLEPLASSSAERLGARAGAAPPRRSSASRRRFRARVDAGATKAGELAAELRRLGGAEAEVRREAAEAGERAGGIDVERARLEAERARRGVGSRRPEPSPRRRGPGGARDRGSSGSSGAARRSARSTRSPRRSTSARRSG